MQPVLAVHLDGASLRLEQVVDRVAGESGVSEAERSERQPSGDLVFAQRVGWARAYLEQLGFLARLERGQTGITGSGAAALASGQPISLPPTDWAAKPVSREAVLAAIELFRTRDRDEILREHGFRRALDYVVAYQGEQFDAKALYGIAYSIDYPEEERIRNRGLQGGREVNRKLEQLGFTVESLRAQESPADEAGPDARAWIIRAGRDGENEDVARDESVVLIGWSDLGPISPEVSREELRERIRKTFGEQRDRSLDAQASSIHRFIHDVADGDVVVLPLQSDRYKASIGVVEGAFRYRADGPFQGRDAHYHRPVRWLAWGVPYDRFDPDLQTAFGVPGTLSEIHKPNAVALLLAATRPSDTSVHLVIKWSSQHGANTVQEHRQIADERGEVWWGVIGRADRPKPSQKWRDELRSQLDDGVPTRVYISGPTCWVTELRDFANVLGDVDEDLIPDYYPSQYEHALWLKLSDFREIDRSWLTEHLESAAEPGKALTSGALSNQTNPLMVRAVGSRPGQTRRVWWVCQGLTYKSARELGVLWAPKAAKDGSSRAYWRALEDAHVGDLVLHYADSHIRAVSVVEEEAVDAPRPDGLGGDWVEGDGWLVHTEYRELEVPLPLAQIPEDWRIAEQGPFTKQGSVQQGYFFSLSDGFVNRLAERFPQLGLRPSGSNGARPPLIDYAEPSFDTIQSAIRALGLRISERTLRRYHVSLKTRGFVVLAGVSGGGKTWLAEAYADVVGAEAIVVPVAPNWTTNEDLLGYLNPIDNAYRHTEFSLFLQRAAAEYAQAQAVGHEPRPFHLILDELNLARVEYYFAKFLSAMEARARYGTAPVALSEDFEVLLTPNLKFVGTVNVDETTFGFADKVYDRAQLIELEAPREALSAHMASEPFHDALLTVWDAVREIAPFAFRVIDEIRAYVAESATLGVDWQPAVDDQLLQKVLPKIKGTDPKIKTALEDFAAATTPAFPLSHDRASRMLEDFQIHGFVSYF